MTPTQAKALLQRLDGLLAIANNDPPATSRRDNEAVREAILWLREVAAREDWTVERLSPGEASSEELELVAEIAALPALGDAWLKGLEAKR